MDDKDKEEEFDLGLDDLPPVEKTWEILPNGLIKTHGEWIPITEERMKEDIERFNRTLERLGFKIKKH